MNDDIKEFYIGEMRLSLEKKGNSEFLRDYIFKEIDGENKKKEARAISGP